VEEVKHGILCGDDVGLDSGVDQVDEVMPKWAGGKLMDEVMPKRAGGKLNNNKKIKRSKLKGNLVSVADVVLCAPSLSGNSHSEVVAAKLPPVLFCNSLGVIFVDLVDVGALGNPAMDLCVDVPLGDPATDLDVDVALGIPAADLDVDGSFGYPALDLVDLVHDVVSLDYVSFGCPPTDIVVDSLGDPPMALDGPGFVPLVDGSLGAPPMGLVDVHDVNPLVDVSRGTPLTNVVDVSLGSPIMDIVDVPLGCPSMDIVGGFLGCPPMDVEIGFKVERVVVHNKNVVSVDNGVGVNVKNVEIEARNDEAVGMDDALGNEEVGKVDEYEEDDGNEEKKDGYVEKDDDRPWAFDDGG